MKKKTKCGKKEYLTEDDVIFIGREQIFLYKSIKKLYYYFCDECESWHLTSKSTDKKIN